MWKLTSGKKILQKKDNTTQIDARRQTTIGTGQTPDMGKSGQLTGYIYILIDASASMRKGNKIKQAQTGAAQFARNAFDQGYYTGMIKFDTSPTLVCEPCKDLALLEKAISKISACKSTHMSKAIRLAHNLLVNQPSMRVIVVVTDGMPNGEGDPQASLAEAEAARKDGIMIIAIGTDDANEDFLKRLASDFNSGIKIARDQLAITIADSARMLPQPRHRIIRTEK